MSCPLGCCGGAKATGRPVPGGDGLAAQFPWRAEVKKVLQRCSWSGQGGLVSVGLDAAHPSGVRLLLNFMLTQLTL